MAIECYDDSCPKHASYKCTDPENCEGPFCFEEKCIKSPCPCLNVEIENHEDGTASCVGKCKI